MTPLDTAHAAMEAAPDDSTARLQFYERLADSEMFLVLEREPDGDKISPVIFDVDGGRFALVFDREERMVEFSEGITPYVAISGRIVAQMLRGQEIGLGVNLMVAPSSMLLPADAVDWLCDTVSKELQTGEGKPIAANAPVNVPEILITSIDTKLATMQGLATSAYLAEFEYESGERAHALAIIDALPDAQNSIARAVSEALTFSGIEAGSLDVIFLKKSDPICAALAKVALRFDLPEPIMAEPFQPSAPGRNPDKPPKLR
ncbi:hypothetical protein GCM10008927_08260 [Amylibacter ulvae]|uniref:SseB protein N-terminal domain-containing protein n=1 Tax=Paramylibacter ulvae TaxID=1651968 RepID=A0ABQ3CXD0_9RHOB|nr:SseB family protein [Amylibacter ulvae]GHA45618.1 hypothetical protein GCM10008927_08260 [Amylibacter ulvae]